MYQGCRTPPSPPVMLMPPPPPPVGVGGGMFPSSPPLPSGGAYGRVHGDKRYTHGHLARQGPPENYTTTQFMHTTGSIVKHKGSDH